MNRREALKRIGIIPVGSYYGTTLVAQGPVPEHHHPRVWKQPMAEYIVHHGLTGRVYEIGRTMVDSAGLWARPIHQRCDKYHKRPRELIIHLGKITVKA